MNIGLNITQNHKKYDFFLTKIKKQLNQYNECKFINVSDKVKLKENISNLDALLTYSLNDKIYDLAFK